MEHEALESGTLGSQATLATVYIDTCKLPVSVLLNESAAAENLNSQSPFIAISAAAYPCVDGNTLTSGQRVWQVELFCRFFHVFSSLSIGLGVYTTVSWRKPPING